MGLTLGKIVTVHIRRIKVETVDKFSGETEWVTLEVPAELRNDDLINEFSKHGKMVGEIHHLAYFDVKQERLGKSFQFLLAAAVYDAMK